MKILLCALSDPVQNLQWARAFSKAAAARNIEVDCSESLMASCTPRQKAMEFNRACVLDSYDWILDISGGNLANTVLPWLDYEAYGQCRAWLAGFSDLTCVLNALTFTCHRPALLFQAAYQQNLEVLLDFLQGNPSDREAPFIHWIHKEIRNPVYAGGNIRCFLKLAGTPWFPDLTGKVLFLEGMNTSPYALESLMAQLSQLKAFEKVQGVVFGVFSQIYKEQESFQTLYLFLKSQMELAAPKGLPWGICQEVGHIPDTKGIWIGRERK